MLNSTLNKSESLKYKIQLIIQEAHFILSTRTINLFQCFYIDNNDKTENPKFN